MNFRLFTPGTAPDEVGAAFERSLRDFLGRYAPLVTNHQHHITIELVRCPNNLGTHVTVQSTDINLSQVGEDAIVFAMAAATEALGQKYIFLAPAKKAAAKAA